jgi:hypothetical protein
MDAAIPTRSRFASQKHWLATQFERSLSLFPLFLTGTSVALAVIGMVERQYALVALGAFLPYVLPLVCYRFISLFAPLRMGVFRRVGQTGYSPWLGAHKLQLIYLSFPVLERILRLVPGLYSAWLRLWGSEIGKGVYWTPRVEVLDRTHLKIGDHVFFGDEVRLIPHAARPRGTDFSVYVAPIEIQSYSFIGAYCRIAPGVVIAQGSIVPVATDLYPKEKTFHPSTSRIPQERDVS